MFCLTFVVPSFCSAIGLSSFGQKMFDLSSHSALLGSYLILSQLQKTSKAVCRNHNVAEGRMLTVFACLLSLVGVGEAGIE